LHGSSGEATTDIISGTVLLNDSASAAEQNAVETPTDGPDAPVDRAEPADGDQPESPPADPGGAEASTQA
jgi:hypothetical protein